MQSKTHKKLTFGIMVIILLSLCLCVTTFALVYSMVSVNNNLFQTGTVKINLNDGKPIIKQDEFLFEPGMTVKKDFFIENEISCDVYYNLYFKEVDGDLGNILQIKICDDTKILFSGTPNSLSRNNVLAADDVLKLNQKRNLQIYFHFPKESNNNYQNRFLSFDFAADAVQTKNNTNRLFN